MKCNSTVIGSDPVLHGCRTGAEGEAGSCRAGLEQGVEGLQVAGENEGGYWGE